MAKGIYIASTRPRSGKSLAALGLMELTARRVAKVGFYRPVVRDLTCDRELSLMRERYGLDDGRARATLSYDEAQALAGAGKMAEVLERVLQDYKRLESECDFVVCEGTDFTGATAAFEFDFNAHVAAHLGTPMFFVSSAAERATPAVIDGLLAVHRALDRERCSVVATLINRVPPAEMDTLREQLSTRWRHSDPVYLVPDEASLLHPSLSVVMESLSCEMLQGEPPQLQGPIIDYTVAAMTLPNFLAQVRAGSLVVTGGDRSDILLGCMAAARSEGVPHIAGVLLTGGLELPESVQRLLEGLNRPELPVLTTSLDTYKAATRIAEMDGGITAQDDRKMSVALALFEEHADLADLEERIAVSRSSTMTPLRFEFELVERARSDRRHIVLPEGEDERVLAAAEVLRRRGVADLTLLGSPAKVRELATKLGLELGDVAILDPLTSEWREEFAHTYFELRKHKGITLDMARDVMGDVSYFGTMMVHSGRADGMVSGAAHTTGHTIRPALEFIRTRPNVTVVSSVFLMCLRDRVLVYGDCAVNPNPTPSQLADIAISSAETAETFGIEPRVAMLSYSTGSSGAGADVEQVREAVELVRQRAPELKVEGPIQYDAAVDAGVARKKLPGSQVAGHANVFIFPDLNTGNNTYKAVQRSAGAVAIGPVLQGLNKPVNDLSRGCSVDDIVNTVAVTAVQAQALGQKP